MSPVNLFTLRRLLLSKQMFFQASMLRLDGSDISRMMACHHFDMAVELALKTILTHLNPTFGDRNVNFPKLWKETDQSYQSKYSSQLPYETEMRRLRDSRNKVQHDGSFPDPADLIQFETSVKDFLDDVLSNVFSLNLEEIYLAEVIRDDKIRQLMKEAEQHLSVDEFDKTVEKSSAAFEYGIATKLREIGTSQRYYGFSRILSSIGPDRLDSSTSYFSFRSGIKELDNFGRELESVKRWIKNTTDELGRMGDIVSTELELLKSINDVLMVGLNYLEYDKFKRAAFHIFIDQEGNYSASRLPERVNTEDEARFCMNFVFNALLLWRL